METMGDVDDFVVVVGGGLGGLAAACTLAARGHRVTLIDKNGWIGGKAAEHREAGFRFDMGPTILTLPSVLRRIFSEAGRRLEDYLELVRLDPQWRCFFADGSTLDLEANVEKMSARLDENARVPGEGRAYREFISYAERLARISDRYFFWRSVGSVMDTLDVRGTFQVSVLRDLLAMRMGQTVAGTIRSYVDDPRVAQMLDHFTQYVGSSPEASPAVLCGIASMQVSEGVWYPVGGTRSVPLALERLARELGVVFRLGERVERILSEGGSVRGVELAEGEVLPAAAVVSNSDSVRTYEELLGDRDRRPYRNGRFEPACSGVVLYLGLRERYSHLLHHNFVFSEDPEEEFDWIYHKGEPAPDPTCYLCAPARTEPETAPRGGEALYVLVHTPYLRPGHDWVRMLSAYRRVILDKLARTAGLVDLEDRLVCERALTPQGIQDRYRVWKGAIYGLASHGRYVGAFKPANRSPSYRGLYLAGGAAHPGPGMPMALMSGWIAADSLDSDAARKGVCSRGQPAGQTREA